MKLGGNLLNGTIPEENIGEMMKNMVYLDWSRNRLSGTIPPAFFEISSNSSSHLFSLDLSHNRLNGTIPSEISNFKKLRHLHLRDNEFEGLIPESFGTLENLDQVTLQYNNFTGNVPLCSTNSSSSSQSSNITSDCLDSNITCNCCTYCCSSGNVASSSSSSQEGGRRCIIHNTITAIEDQKIEMMTPLFSLRGSGNQVVQRHRWRGDGE